MVTQWRSQDLAQEGGKPLSIIINEKKIIIKFLKILKIFAKNFKYFLILTKKIYKFYKFYKTSVKLYYLNIVKLNFIEV